MPEKASTVGSENRRSRKAVVGVPVRNEAGTIVDAVGHVVRACEALRLAHPEVDVSCVVCFNGCTDASEAVLRDALQSAPPAVEVRCTTSPPGIIPAMAQVLDIAGEVDVIFFCDGDIVVTETSLAHLYETLCADDGVQLAYARAQTMLPTSPSWLQRLLCTAFTDPLLYPARRFFRGSCYVVRPELFHNGCIDLWRDASEAPAAVVRGRRRVPLADDVIMSVWIVERYGLAAIRRDAGALVLVTPPLNLADTFLGYRRKHFDYRTLDAIWPQRTALLRSLGKTPVQWRYVARQTPRHVLWLLAYVALRQAVDAAAWADAALAWWGLPHAPAELFGARRTTKQLHACDQQPLATLTPRAAQQGASRQRVRA
jgi:glycosyltransferase involved in cell wall biosynthesis